MSYFDPSLFMAKYCGPAPDAGPSPISGFTYALAVLAGAVAIFCVDAARGARVAVVSITAAVSAAAATTTPEAFWRGIRCALAVFHAAATAGAARGSRVPCPCVPVKQAMSIANTVR